MGIAWIGPVLVYSVLMGVAGLLLFLAFRRKGLLPPDACLCGYSTEGNDSGICPECGQPLGEAMEKAEWRRLRTAVRRVMYLLLALTLLGVPTLVGVSSLVGRTNYAECRTLLAPLDGSYGRAELTWRVNRTKPGVSYPVTVDLTSAGGVTSREKFSRISMPGGVRNEVITWASSLGIDPSANGGATLHELGEAVEAATKGQEVLLVGGKGAAHVLLASGSVVTQGHKRLPQVMLSVVWVGVAVLGSVAVFRRSMGRTMSARRLAPVTPAD